MICGFAYFSLVNRLLLFGARAGEPRTAAAFRPWYIFFNFRLTHMEIPRMWMDVDCGWCQCKLTDAQRTLVAPVCEREWGIFDVCALHWMRERVDAKCDRTHYTTIYTLMAVTSSLFVLLWSVLNWPSRRHTYLHVYTHTRGRSVNTRSRFVVFDQFLRTASHSRSQSQSQQREWVFRRARGRCCRSLLHTSRSCIDRRVWRIFSHKNRFILIL